MSQLRIPTQIGTPYFQHSNSEGKNAPLAKINNVCYLQDSDDSFEVAHMEAGKLQVQIAVVAQTIGQVMATRFTRPVLLACALRKNMMK